jgi:hypothetical protein
VLPGQVSDGPCLPLRTGIQVEEQEELAAVKHLRYAAGGLAALAVLLAACSSSLRLDPGLPTIGPFGTGGVTALLCAPVPAGGVVTYGIEGFPNKGGTAKITKVSLVDPEHLQMVQAWVVRRSTSTAPAAG